MTKEKCGNLLLTNSLPHFQGDPGGTRTHDPLIKSQLLYQLSYGVIAHSIAVQRYCFFLNRQLFLSFFSKKNSFFQIQILLIYFNSLVSKHL